MQGLLAARSDPATPPRVLAAVEGAQLAVYRPLGWGPRDTVLLESRSGDVGRSTLRVLAWDVTGSRLFRVAEVDDPVEPDGTDAARAQAFTGSWAL